MVIERRPPRGPHALVGVLLMCSIALSDARADASPPIATMRTTAPQALWLAVKINSGSAGDPVLLLEDTNGRLLARGADLTGWRLPLPTMVAAIQDGESYYALDALHGLTYRVDTPTQVLIVDAPAALFPTTRLRGQSAQYSAPPPPPLGAFLNYDLSAQDAAGHTRGSGFFELGVFNGWGVGTASAIAREGNDGSPFVRLDTTWTQDHPADMASLRIGDSISDGGDWGRSIRFGGVQWASNFATQPGFIPFALPGFAGSAALPSTVDLYVDDALRMRRDVPAGPFAIGDLPVVTGSGTATLVVRDLLGREQQVSLPYYASPRLLQAGLNEFSYAAGYERENYGFESNDYGRFAAVGTQRYGFTDWLTGEAHVEALHDQQTAGVGGSVLLPSAGVLSVSLAGSRSTNAAQGALAAIGFEDQGNHFGFGGSIQYASPHFLQLGLPNGTFAPRTSGQAYASWSTTRYGSFGLNYTVQDDREQRTVRLAGASYSVKAGRFGYLTASALRILSGVADTTYGLVYTLPLGQRTSVSTSIVHQADGNQAAVDLQRNLPAGDGYGYRLQAGGGTDPRIDAAFSAQNSHGTLSLEAERLDGQTSARGEVSGSVVMFGGDTFFSRRIDQSFGVIEVPGYPNVQVYAENQPVATTNSAGNALVPRLRAYQDNAIRIEQDDLPLDAEIDTLQLPAVPFLRSGVLVRFPVKRSLGGLITVTLDNDQPLPEGAEVRVAGQSTIFPSASNGQVYLTGLSPSNEVTVSWHEQRCELVVRFPPTTDPLPNLGTYRCSGVTP